EVAGGRTREVKTRGKCPTDDKWKTKYQEADRVVMARLPALPKSWGWASLGELAWDSGYGTSDKCDYEGKGVAVLRIPNIASGEMDQRNMRGALKPGADPEMLVTRGDMLIVRTNGSRDLIGRAAVVVDHLPEPTSLASYLIRFRLVSLVPCRPGLADSGS